MTYNERLQISNVNLENLLSKIDELPTMQPGADINIEVSENPPSETDKLWIKTSVIPKKIIFTDVDIVDKAAKFKSTGVTGPTGSRFAYGVVNDKLYFCGGINADSYNLPYTPIYIFNGENIESVDIFINSSTPENFSYGGAIGTTFLLTGNQGTSAPYIFGYDTLTGEISTLSGYSTNIPDGNAMVYSDKLYIFSGGGSYVYIVDLETGMSTTVSFTDLPTNSSGPGSIHPSTTSIVMNDKIYIPMSDPTTEYNRIYLGIFDTENNTLDTSNNRLGIEIGFAGHCEIGKINDNIYYFVTGGPQISMWPDIDHIIKEDTLTGIKSTITVSTKIPYNSAICNIKNDLYLVGGKDYSHDTVNTIMKFTESSEGILEKDAIAIKTSKNNKFNLVKNELFDLSVGVDAIYLGDDSNKSIKIDGALYSDNEWRDI